MVIAPDQTVSYASDTEVGTGSWQPTKDYLEWALLDDSHGE